MSSLAKVKPGGSRLVQGQCGAEFLYIADGAWVSRDLRSDRRPPCDKAQHDSAVFFHRSHPIGFISLAGRLETSADRSTGGFVNAIMGSIWCRASRNRTKNLVLHRDSSPGLANFWTRHQKGDDATANLLQLSVHGNSYSAGLSAASEGVKIPGAAGVISIWRLWNCARLARWPIETIVVAGSILAKAS